MSTRVNPFANLTEPLPVFTTKPKREKPVEKEAIARIAEDNNFPSRQAAKTPKEPRRKRRVYTTGRNRQFNIKATTETIERFYKMADERNVSLCKLLEHALDALEGEGQPRNRRQLKDIAQARAAGKGPKPRDNTDFSPSKSRNGWLICVSKMRCGNESRSSRNHQTCVGRKPTCLFQNLARIEGPAPKYSIWMWSLSAPPHSGQRMFHRVGAYLMLWKPLKAKKKRSRLLSGIMTLAAGC